MGEFDADLQYFDGEFRVNRGTFWGDESMASRNLFTEEGRTRVRNFGLQLRSYLLVFLGLGLLVGAVWFRNHSADWRAGNRGIYTNSIEDLPYVLSAM